MQSVFGPFQDSCAPAAACKARQHYEISSNIQAILDALPIGVVVQDELGEVVYASRIAADHLTLPASEVAAWLPAAPINNTLASNHNRTADGARNTVFQTTRQHVRHANQSYLVSTSLDVTAQKFREESLWRAAFFDDLTNLPNRRLLEDHMNEKALAANSGEQFALVFLDIDYFKQINDFYGHAAGDGLLVELTKRISRNIRESDIISRISGDEFLLLLNPVESESEAAGILETLLEHVRRPFYVDGFEILASASAGMSIFPHHGKDYNSLRQNADVAMYKAKGHARGNMAIFNIGMQHEAVHKMESEQRLRQAIVDKQVCCAYQPKVNIRTQEIEGVEVLARLRNEAGEVQAPATFIDLAVELGLIDDLTHLVLHEIKDSIDIIDDAFGSGVRLSINVAAKQAANHKFMVGYAEALKATGYPERFVIEITEDAFISKSEFQRDILPMLRSVGVGISIDDFGVGYSSLSALADMTADELKIDRSFITDIHKRPRSQGILRAIESLGEALNIKVVAEGIETFEELAYLQAATRITVAQGYYFSKPIFLEQFDPARLGPGTLRNHGATARSPERASSDVRFDNRNYLARTYR
jgi:cyclic di-GMP phosphodiesterase Gmr